jgi:hypothetical protein
MVEGEVDLRVVHVRVMWRGNNPASEGSFCHPKLPSVPAASLYGGYMLIRYEATCCYSSPAFSICLAAQTPSTGSARGSGACPRRQKKRKRPASSLSSPISVRTSLLRQDYTSPLVVTLLTSRFRIYPILNRLFTSY